MLFTISCGFKTSLYKMLHLFWVLYHHSQFCNRKIEGICNYSMWYKINNLGQLGTDFWSQIAPEKRRFTWRKKVLDFVKVFFLGRDNFPLYLLEISHFALYLKNFVDVTKILHKLSPFTKRRPCAIRCEKCLSAT